MANQPEWRPAPVLGVRDVRRTAEYYRDTRYGELRQRGASLAEPPRNAPYGLREIPVEDLNGYRIAFGGPPRT